MKELDQIITLTELRAFQAQGLSLEAVCRTVEAHHGLARIFEAESRLGPARYFVLLLDEHGDPILNPTKPLALTKSIGV